MLSKKEFKAEVAREKQTHKEQLKHLKKIYKDQDKEIKVKKIDHGPLLSRLEYAADSLTLRVCEPFERKAADIRFKRWNPEAYAARIFVREITPLVEHLQKKSEKKTLSEREQGLLIKLDTKLLELTKTVDTNYLDVEDIERLQASILMALPQGVRTELEGAEKVLDAFNQFLAMGQQVAQAVPYGQPPTPAYASV